MRSHLPQLNIWKLITWGFVFLFLATVVPVPPTSDAHHLTRLFPQTANYYLGEIKNDPAFLHDLGRYDVLILTPAQIKANTSIVLSLKTKHPGMIVLAYVPSQSYNTRYWPDDIIFKNLVPKESWWLRDPAGNTITPWPDLRNTNMSREWSEHLVHFTNDRIAGLIGVDGIFFDIVSESISWANGGNIDLDGNGVRDTAAQADALWRARTQSFLAYARANIFTTYIVINGSSHPDYQPHVNGRMFETFPTPWEGDGSWTTVMNNLIKNKPANRAPQIVIINGNTLNTGERNNFKAVRFGMTSSLLEDNVFYSFDFGDADHGQLWWYDEYNVDLGKALSDSGMYVNNSQVVTGLDAYSPGVWRRDFAQGIAVVNSGTAVREVDLGGEYEKIHGVQDRSVNDGTIVSETTLAPNDGIILLKTYATIPDVVFTNGDFARLFRPNGERVRNGFFVYSDAYRGGDQISETDLDRNNLRDLVVINRTSLATFRHDGQQFMKVFPYTANYSGTMNIAVGDITNDGNKDIIVAPSAGQLQPIKIYSHDGELIKDNWFPLGAKYRGGYSVAVGNVDSDPYPEIIVGAGTGVRPDVYIYDLVYRLERQWTALPASFRGGISVAAGDVNGDDRAEIIVGPGKGLAPTVRIFDERGRQVFKEFRAFTSFTNPGIRVAATDVDFDGNDDVIVWSTDIVQ